jgi:uncharacterized protein
VARAVVRASLFARVQRSLREFPVTLLVGPRQCGKTTLARALSESQATYFDLEDPESPLRPEVAKRVLEPLRGLVVIDEFQRQPKLFELLRVLADRPRSGARFLILGSASPELVRGASESLAGRVGYCEMSGFDVSEIAPTGHAALWLRGGYPRSLLARSDAAAFTWRQSFVQTFLERDIPQLGIRVPAQALRRFWTMLAHYHGQIWNAAELARSMGVGENAVRHYLDVLSGAFMVRQLPPWFENIGKRLVKSPRIYLRDSGLLHLLLGLPARRDVLSHPKLGASWEGFALEQVVRLLNADREAFFYRTHAGTELDLLIVRGNKRYGFEFKYRDAPEATKSMHMALADLRLESLRVVYPGERAYSLDERIQVMPLSGLPELATSKALK